MKKIFSFIFSIAVCNLLYAQNNPVHFSFSTERKNDSLVYFAVKAKLDSGFFLFSVKPQNSDDAFISQLNLDSNSTKYLHDTSIVQSSNIHEIKDDKTNSTFRGFTDSAQFL